MTAVRVPIRKRVRQGWLVVHVVSGGAWIGIDVVLGVLVLAALLGPDAGAAAAALRVLPLLFWPLLSVGLACLVSGGALGLGSRWGLLRYRWVVVKLVLTVVLLVLVVVVLRGGLERAAAQGAAGGPDPAAGAGLLLFPPAVSITALVVASVLGVVKPWGRVRRSHVGTARGAGADATGGGRRGGAAGPV